MNFQNYYYKLTSHSGIQKLKILSKHYSNLLRLKTAEARSQAKIIASKILKLLKQLSNAYQKKTLEKIIGLSIYSLLVVINSPSAKAQTFLSQVPVEYNFTKDSLAIVFPNLVDIDNDGDLDIMSAVYPLDTYEPYFGFAENIGTATEPSFDTLNRDPFSLPLAIVSPSILARHDYADMDGDGDLDIVGASIYYASINQMYLFENLGSPESPEFGAVQTTSLFSDYESIWAPTAISDVDQDGDLDLLSLAYYTYETFNIYYQVIWLENKGSSTSMDFSGGSFVPLAVPEIYKGFDTYAFPGLEAKDFDNDGDDDILLIGSSYYYTYQTELHYFENLGNGSFSSPSLLEDLADNGGLSTHDLVTAGDIDGDGDMDLLSEVYFPYSTNQKTTNLFFIENTSLVKTENPSELSGSFEIHSNPLESPIILNYEIEETEKLQITIFDNQGKLLLERNNEFYAGQSSLQIDINSLNAGFYFLKLTGASGSKTMKFIVK